MTHTLFSEAALPAMHELITQVETPSVVDFAEQIQLSSVRATTQLWYQEEILTAFSYVDTYNNLRFEVHPEYESAHLFKEIVEWGALCMRRRNAKSQKQETLDASCFANDTKRLALYKAYDFEPESIRTLNYVRDLAEPLADCALPAGFTLSHVADEEQAEAVVSVHRAAFGTDNMSIEERLAMMRVPNYEKELDLLALSPSGDIVGNCVCELENEREGWTDPITILPEYQGQGIGKAILTAGLKTLKHKNISTARLGTSNQNTTMMRLAESVGFQLDSEKLWFAKRV